MYIMEEGQECSDSFRFYFRLLHVDKMDRESEGYPRVNMWKVRRNPLEVSTYFKLVFGIAMVCQDT